MKADQNGGILSCALVLLLIASVVSIRAASIRTGIQRLRTENLIKHRNDGDALQSLSNRLNNNGMNSGTLECFGNSNQRQLCLRSNKLFSEIRNQQFVSLTTLAFKGAFPQFDFNTIFSAPDLCPGLVTGQQNRTTNTGLILSPASTVWHETCELTSLSAHEKLTMNGNIQGMGLKLTGEGPLRLAATGFIAIQSLEINGNATILAAGDVIIDHLTVPDKSELVLVSVSGFISIHEMTGSPFIQTIAGIGAAISGKASGPAAVPPDLLKESQLIYLDYSE